MEQHMNQFKGRHLQRDIILWAVRRYCKSVLKWPKFSLNEWKGLPLDMHLINSCAIME